MGAAGAKVPARQLPNWLVRLAALRDPALKQLVPELGKPKNGTNAKARGLLGWKPRSSRRCDRRERRKPDPPRTSERHHETSSMNDFFRRYLLPGFVFESAVIAGGYATGRELVEFFLPAGPWGGVLGMIVSMLFWSAVLMVSFELARMAKAYDYRSFFKLLLGPRLVPVRDRLLPADDHRARGDGRGRRRNHARPVRLAEAGRLDEHDRRDRPHALLQQHGHREVPGVVGRLSLSRLHRVLHLELRRVRRSHRGRVRGRAGRRRLVQGRHHVCRLQRRDHSGSALLHPPPDAPARGDGRGPARRAARHAAGRRLLHRDGRLPATRSPTSRCPRRSCSASSARRGSSGRSRSRCC